MLQNDGKSAAEQRAVLMSDDRRVSQYWDEEKIAARSFAQALVFPRPLWDAYLVYKPGIRWTGNVPPAPTWWMHQLTGADPALRLDPDRFTRDVEQMLEGR